jgi:hypothetical protein
VEPVPTPTMVPSFTYGIAARAAARFLSLEFMGDPLSGSRNDNARLRGHLSFRFGSDERGKVFPRSPNSKAYFFLAAFFLAFFFAFAMLASPVTGLVRGRSIRTRYEITSKPVRDVIATPM